MKCWIGVGSNLGNRQTNLENAAIALRDRTRAGIRTSPIIQTPALTLPGAPEDWRIPYLNAGIEIDWNASARELLSMLKSMEKELGRTDAAR